MNARPKYRTKQRDLLLRYLESMPGVHITAGDVCEHFESQGMPIGQTTVYRQLESMVDEGLVQKYIIDASDPACFEYVGGRHCETGVCYHCKCEKCGRLFHVSAGEMNALSEYLEKSQNFILDPKRTVFYGLCRSCA
ncbi:MAG: transcriptional repressor [Clostridia bacterium]|nr:transcriptional repressor [Clostridia bacterium]